MATLTDSRRAKIAAALRRGPRSHSDLYTLVDGVERRHLDCDLAAMRDEGLIEEYIPEGEGFRHTTYRLAR